MNNKKLKIAVLPGDGIGQEVVSAVLPVFNILNLNIDLIFGNIGWDMWCEYGDPIPKTTWDIIQQCDTILLGATTSKPLLEANQELSINLQNKDLKYTSPIVQLRQKLDLFANIRPCFSVDNNKKFSFTIIRENTEGLYAGFDYASMPDEFYSLISKNKKYKNYHKSDLSCSLRIQSKQGLERIFKYAFDYAQKNNLSRVTFADKPNVLRNSSNFARNIFEKIASKYNNITADIHNVDAIALWLVKKPEEFDIIVAENMFGDILSDLGAGVMGGLGLAPSANIGLEYSYFEPVHGSAPRIFSNKANPSAMFLTVAMLLDKFNYNNQADIIRKSVINTIKMGINNKKLITYDLGGTASTIEAAENILKEIKKYL